MSNTAATDRPCPGCATEGGKHLEGCRCKPGSDFAREHGCNCPVLDNAGGRGLGDGLYWVRATCLLHGEPFFGSMGRQQPEPQTKGEDE